MTQNNSPVHPPDDHALPSRRERLRMLMRLKSQRQMLAGGVGAALLLCAGLGTALVSEAGAPDVVDIGEGRASVEAQPLSAFEPNARQPGTPSQTESPMGIGEASYYGPGLEGNLTANGEIFDPGRLTAAHRTLPLGSRVRVTNVRNGETVVVRINDRGPYHGNRVIDLSEAAAREIGLIRSGTGRVEMALIT